MRESLRSKVRAAFFILLLLFVPTAVSANARAETKSSSTFTLPSGVTVTITEAPFDKSKFTVSGCSDDNPCFINGHIPFGLGTQLPRTYVKSITVSFKGQSYALDASDMYDAWGNRPLEVRGVVRYFGGQCSEIKYCQFRGLFSDGIGSFVAEWVIADGKPFRTVLTGSEDIVDLVSKNIDPPEYN